MHPAILEFTESLIADAKMSGADKLLLGHLPAGTNPGVYSGPVDTGTPVAELESAHKARALLTELAMSQAGLNDAIVTSSLSNDSYPVWCHIPKQSGWFQVDGFPCGLLPHILVVLSDMATRGNNVQTINVTEALSHEVTLKV
jgi:hypothetical protein